MPEPAPEPQEAQAAPADGPAPPVTAADYLAAAALLAAFVATQVLAVLFARPFLEAELQAFEDPQDTSNSVWYILLLLAFTGLILYIAKKGKKWLIQAIILTAVGSTVAYVVAPMLMSFGVGVLASWGVGGAVGLASVVALLKRPEWYVIDVVGILVAAGAASLFGISLGLVPVVVLLVGLAVYDALAVYKTKHMLSLADSVIELRLPVLLVVPKHRGYSFLREAARFKEAGPENKDEREAFFMGLGDLVMPTILVVSSLVFPPPGSDGVLEAVGAAVGTLVGYAVLMGYVMKGNPQAGLPLLNGGAIAGFLAGVYAATGGLVFW